ncbi:hypothetical protein GQ600_13286 [Phytophthora cactorum]|nr:hypothetical protein GQ600_13286 [Phytophthora cactorum]
MAEFVEIAVLQPSSEATEIPERLTTQVSTVAATTRVSGWSPSMHSMALSSFRLHPGPPLLLLPRAHLKTSNLIA